MAGLKQRPELLSGEVAGERPAGWGAVQLALAMFDGRTDGEEFRHVLAPLVAPDVQANPPHAVSVELVGFLFHAGHGELACLVHRLGENLHLLALLPLRLLVADVINRATDDKSQRLKSRLADE